MSSKKVWSSDHPGLVIITGNSFGCHVLPPENPYTSLADAYVTLPIFDLQKDSAVTLSGLEPDLDELLSEDPFCGLRLHNEKIPMFEWQTSMNRLTGKAGEMVIPGGQIAKFPWSKYQASDNAARSQKGHQAPKLIN